MRAGEGKEKVYDLFEGKQKMRRKGGQWVDFCSYDIIGTQEKTSPVSLSHHPITWVRVLFFPFLPTSYANNEDSR